MVVSSLLLLLLLLLAGHFAAPWSGAGAADDLGGGSHTNGRGQLVE